MNSRVIKTFLQWTPNSVDVPLKNGLRVQILPTMDDLARARKHQFAAFIADEGLLVVWDDDAMQVLARAKQIENELMHLVWSQGQPEEEEDEKKAPRVTEVEIDPESGAIVPEQRPTHMMNTVLVTCTLCIIIVMLGAGFRQLAIEIMVDKGYARLAFMLLIPVQVFFTLVSSQAVFFLPRYFANPSRSLSSSSSRSLSAVSHSS